MAADMGGWMLDQFLIYWNIMDKCFPSIYDLIEIVLNLFRCQGIDENLKKENSVFGSLF